MAVDEVRVIAWRGGLPCWTKDYSMPTARLLLGSPVWVDAVLERTGAERLQAVDVADCEVDLRGARAAMPRPGEEPQAFNRRSFKRWLSESEEGDLYRGGGG